MMRPTTPSDLRIRRSTLYLRQRRLAMRHGDFTVHFFRDLARGESAMALVRGELGGSSPILARVHSACLTSECLQGRDCDCAEQLDGALAMMARAEAGVLYYLMQEGRGAGLTAKARDRMFVQASGNRITTFEAYAEMGLPSDLRRYDVIAPMSRLLGLRAPICLLTNNPEKAAAVTKSLAEEGIEVVRRQAIQGPTSAFNSDYLSAKHDSGHALERPAPSGGARPPEPVAVVPPVVLPGDPNRILTASYLLPVAVHDGVEWLRLSVVFDGASGRESIVLAHRATPKAEWLAEATRRTSGGRFVRMSLADRLPVVLAPGRDALKRHLHEIAEAGHGCVCVHFDDRDRAAR